MDFFYVIKRMDSISIQPFLFIIIFFSFQPSISLEICSTLCGSQTIRFPFRLIDQPQYCGYQDFELSCQVQETTQDVTILTFPYAGNFSVFHIDYAQQVVQLSYSEGCLPGILLQGLNLSGSPFMSVNTQSYTFYNCSTMVQYPGVTKIPCLSGFNFYVVAILTDGYTPSTSVCLEIAKVMVPMSTDWWEDGMTLGWNQPDCRWCESHQGTCLFENVGAGLQVRCGSAIKHGLPSSVRDALVFGLGISLVCLIAIISCVKLNFTEGQNHPNPEILMTHPRSTPGSTKGLDRQTIDTYPTTLLGPSRCLPNPRDNICSICLCEYQANETLRTIPNCSHYFHVDCIDQWLKLMQHVPNVAISLRSLLLSLLHYHHLCPWLLFLL